MLKSINNYELNDNVTVEKLLEIGFKKIDNNILSYYYNLCDDIDLFLHIHQNKNTISFNENVDVEVIDDSFGQYYQPFYDDKSFEYLNKVIKSYNNKMNELTELGILKQKQKQKKLKK